VIVETEDHTLSEQIKNGNIQAFETIFKSDYAQFCAYANKIVKDIDIAEEIVQEVFFQLLQKHEEITGIISYKSYVYRSVHNGCLNFLKHKKVEMKHSDHVLSEAGNNQEIFVDDIETSELQNKIRQAIDKLPTERKRIFLMIRFDELKYSEVAEKLNLSIKTIENQMNSALKFMRQELKDYLPIILVTALTILTYFKNMDRGI